ncbi:MAG: protein phosphatase CheZ [Alphaproteobacteria bacterium]|nr:protein phosphatase CheZ [Alphaproteobacteria bacterium]MBL7098436.1 protein phosphatase CheZ [Alphaproteobacteria bacterium]
MLHEPPPGTGQPIELGNAHSYLNRVIAELQSLRTEKKHPLLNVLQYLSDHIRQTRQELGALRTRDGNPLLGSAADELEEVVAETARAANEIMGAAEAIEALMPQVEKDVSAALLNAVTRIYEASAFQDITGQRITKIIRAVQDIEEKIGTLAQACGDGEIAGGDPVGDAALLNGPQLGKTAATQDDIDALFDSV